MDPVPPAALKRRLQQEIRNNPFLDVDDASARRVLVVIGTRPEGIKLAPVVTALEARAAEVRTRVALTGQHSELLDQVLEVFGLRPDWDLGIMREGQDLYDVAHACLDGLREVVREYRPDIVLVQGDTATVFLASLVAFFEKTKVGHVEAGLRSHDKWRPYPEEIFRRLSGVVADVHFAPTAGARRNLLAENVPAASVHLTGNTVVDAMLHVASRERPVRDAQLRRVLDEKRRFVLLTAHRRESFGAPLREAFGAVRTLAERFDDVTVLYPVHPNPNVKSAAADAFADHPRILLTDPLDYLDLVAALQKAELVITDSGGIQEEAPTFGKPVLVLREVTERPEGVDAGIAALVGTDAESILARASEVLRGEWNGFGSAGPDRRGGTTAHRTIDPSGRPQRREFTNPYGDGRAGERIADITIATLTGAARRTADWNPPA